METKQKNLKPIDLVQYMTMSEEKQEELIKKLLNRKEISDLFKKNKTDAK